MSNMSCTSAWSRVTSFLLLQNAKQTNQPKQNTWQLQTSPLETVQPKHSADENFFGFCSPPVLVGFAPPSPGPRHRWSPEAARPLASSEPEAGRAWPKGPKRPKCLWFVFFLGGGWRFLLTSSKGVLLRHGWKKLPGKQRGSSHDKKWLKSSALGCYYRYLSEGSSNYKLWSLDCCICSE